MFSPPPPNLAAEKKEIQKLHKHIHDFLFFLLTLETREMLFPKPLTKKKKRQTTKHCLNREAIGISIVTTTAITHTHKKKKKMKKEIHTRVSHIGRGHHFLSVFSFQIRIFFFFPFILNEKHEMMLSLVPLERGWGGHKWLY